MHSIKKTTLSWNPDSIISRIEAGRNLEGKRYVHVYAKEGVEASALGNLPNELHRYGFQNIYADAVDGHNMLVIADARQTDCDKLEKLLRDHNYIKGETKTATFEDKSQTEGLLNRVQRNSLKLSGKFGFAGQVALGAAGWIAGDRARMQASGIGMGMEGMNSVFGNGKDSVDVNGMIHDAVQYAKGQGIPLPPLEGEQYESSVMRTLKHAVARHSFPAVQAAGAYGCALTVKSGLQDGNIGRIAVGGINGLGKAVTLLVPEKNAEQKRIEQEDAEKNGKTVPDRSAASQLFHGLSNVGRTMVTHPFDTPAALLEVTQCNPLGIDGALRVSDNGFGFVDAYQQMGTIRRDWKDPSQAIKLKESKIAAYGDPKQSQGIIKILEGEQAKLNAQLQGRGVEAAPSLGRRILETIHLKSPPADSVRGIKVKLGDVNKQLSEFRSIGSVKGEIRATLAKGLHQEIEVLEGKQKASTNKYMRITAMTLPWITATTWLISSSLSMISSKNGNGKPEDDPAFAKLFAWAAEEVNKLPKDQQQAALSHIADFLTTDPQMRELGVTTKLFMNLVEKRMKTMEASPWVARVHAAATVAAAQPQAQVSASL